MKFPTDSLILSLLCCQLILTYLIAVRLGTVHSEGPDILANQFHNSAYMSQHFPKKQNQDVYKTVLFSGIGLCDHRVPSPKSVR